MSLVGEKTDILVQQGSVAVIMDTGRSDGSHSSQNA